MQGGEVSTRSADPDSTGSARVRVVHGRSPSRGPASRLQRPRPRGARRWAGPIPEGRGRSVRNDARSCGSSPCPDARGRKRPVAVHGVIGPLEAIGRRRFARAHHAPSGHLRRQMLAKGPRSWPSAPPPVSADDLTVTASANSCSASRIRGASGWRPWLMSVSNFRWNSPASRDHGFSPAAPGTNRGGRRTRRAGCRRSGRRATGSPGRRRWR